ncbi:MAG: GNAT family N-acetyltransferase [Phycisphaerales bacterium JB065]
MSPNATILTTKRLSLRLPSPDDLDEYAPIFADPEVMRYIGDGSLRSADRVALSIERSVVLFEERSLGIFLVIERDSGAVLGDCLLVPIMRSGTDPNDPHARGPETELGYRLCRSAWGKGYATEAATALLHWALGNEGPRLREVIAVTYPQNLASQRVLLKSGFRHEGQTEAFYNITAELFRASAHPDDR